MAYDGLDRRRSATINGTQTNFLYDGWNPIQEQNSSGGATLNILSGLALNEVFATTDGSGGSQQDVLTDRLGTSVATSDSAGAIQTSYTYEPYGSVTAGASSTNRYRFTGQPDDGTGVDYWRLRYYAPTWGRFLSEDPLGPPTNGADLYPYANGDPIGFDDPTGAGVLSDLADVGHWLGGARKGIQKCFGQLGIFCFEYNPFTHILLGTAIALGGVVAPGAAAYGAYAVTGSVVVAVGVSLPVLVVAVPVVIVGGYITYRGVEELE